MRVKTNNLKTRKVTSDCLGQAAHLVQETKYFVEFHDALFEMSVRFLRELSKNQARLSGLFNSLPQSPIVSTFLHTAMAKVKENYVFIVSGLPNCNVSIKDAIKKVYTGPALFEHHLLKDRNDINLSFYFSGEQRSPLGRGKSL